MPSSTSLLSVLATAIPLFHTTFAHGSAGYTLQDDLSYKNFFSNFKLFSEADPTNGFVQYQALDSAMQKQYVGYFEDTKSVYLGVDFETKNPKGRASVRAESKKTWNQGLLVADIRHMPDSTCGSWPAFWLLGVGEDGKTEWPQAGEIDILEGVNDYTSNAVTLHTTTGCAVDNSTANATTPATGQTSQDMPYLGSMSTDNCDVKAADQDKNVGCSIKAPKPESPGGLPTYGTDFNNAGGGVYALEWTSDSISAWFFPRNSSVLSQNFAGNTTANSTLDPATFGTPLAKFQGSGCDFNERFKDMKIIFNTAFCGDWAGKIWDDSCKAKTKAATCEEYVQNNPEVFADSYWEIAGLKWYQKSEDSDEMKKRAIPIDNGFVHVKQRGRTYHW